MTPGIGIARESVHDGSLALYFDVVRHRLYPFLSMTCACRLDGLMGTGSNKTSDDTSHAYSRREHACDVSSEWSAPFFAGRAEQVLACMCRSVSPRALLDLSCQICIPAPLLSLEILVIHGQSLFRLENFITAPRAHLPCLPWHVHHVVQAALRR